MKFRLGTLCIALTLILSACSAGNFTKEKEEPIQNNDSNIEEDIQQNSDNQNKAEEPIVSESPTNQEDTNEIETKPNSELTLDAEFFNQVENVNGQPTIVNPENILVMVNKEVALQKDYQPNDLVRPNVSFSFGDQQLEKSLMRKDAALALEKMFVEANKNGVKLVAASGYRSYERQEFLFNQEVENVGLAKAEVAVAKPGMSEHQTGLTMDITSASMNYSLSEDFENQVEGKWLIENAHRFGFILRYPKSKESITKYKYEPWHYRYVGVEAATLIHENGWTLEEYFKNVKKV